MKYNPFRAKDGKFAKRSGDMFENAIHGTWDYMAKTFIIIYVVGLAYGVAHYRDIIPASNKTTYTAQAEVFKSTATTTEGIRRDKEVQKNILRVAADIENDAEFKKGTERALEIVKEARKRAALEKAMFVYKTGYEAQQFEMINQTEIDLSKLLQ